MAEMSGEKPSLCADVDDSDCGTTDHDEDCSSEDESLVYLSLDWYEVPIIYDIVFQTDTLSEVQFLQSALQRFGLESPEPSTSRLLEPACGTGRIAVELAKLGFHVHGFDISEPSLAFARDRALREGTDVSDRMTLSTGRMEEFELADNDWGTYDAAYNLVSSFKHVLEADDAASHLQLVHRALKPGGIYCLGLHVSDYTDLEEEREKWIETREGLSVIAKIFSSAPDVSRNREVVRVCAEIQGEAEPGSFTAAHAKRLESGGKLLLTTKYSSLYL